MAARFVASRGMSLRIQEVTDPADPGDTIYADGRMLASPHATLAGPPFEAWLDSGDA